MGHQKPQSLYRTVLWGVVPMAMAVHLPSRHPEQVSAWGWPQERASWTFPGHEGEELQVRVFARGCEAVTLLLDGKSVGTAPVQARQPDAPAGSGLPPVGTPVYSTLSSAAQAT